MDRFLQATWVGARPPPLFPAPPTPTDGFQLDLAMIKAVGQRQYTGRGDQTEKALRQEYLFCTALGHLLKSVCIKRLGKPILRVP